MADVAGELRSVGVLTNCPTKMFGESHDTFAKYVLDEHIEGKHYRLYAHGARSKRHEMRNRCEE